MANAIVTKYQSNETTGEIEPINKWFWCNMPEKIVEQLPVDLSSGK